MRDQLLDRSVKTAETYKSKKVRTVCYLSAEFSLGPQLGNNLVNLCAVDTVKQAIEALGLDFEELVDQEEEPGLGSGGLGRLAACYLDSLATLQIPSIGYGIRYEFGIFDQQIRDGWQVEMTDKWLRLGNPWEIPRPEIAAMLGSAATPSRTPTRKAAIAFAGFPRASSEASPTTPRSSAIGSTRQICSACGVQRRSNRSISNRSTSVTTMARWSRKSPPRRSARCSIRTIPRCRASGSARAAVLFRLMRASGHDAHLPADGA